MDPSGGYVTLTVVVSVEAADDVTRVLRKHDDVMFVGTELGVTDVALAAGAEPGDWPEP